VPEWGACPNGGLLTYGAFTQTATYSIANQLGFFTAYGLEVAYQQVPNSTYAYAQILNGGFDVLIGTIDNSINLRLNSNENVAVVGRLGRGPGLVLALSPGITSIAQLKNKSPIVDSPTSGYSCLLRGVLSTCGLLLGTGCFFQV